MLQVGVEIGLRSIFPATQGFPGLPRVAQTVKNPPAVQETRFNAWVGKIPWRGNGYPLQYSCLENSKDRGAWRATVHDVTKIHRESNVAE